MPGTFSLQEHGLQKLRVESYRGLVFATFDFELESLANYIGPEMRPFVDRIFHKPIEYLGCTRQFSRSNWKLYLENVKDPYHASLLHLFHTTFNIFRVGMRAELAVDERHGLHSAVLAIADKSAGAEAYKAQSLRSYDEEFGLEDPSILDLVEEHELVATNHIQPIFPQLIVQQIHNTLVARQLLPKGPDSFELIFHYFGYADDSPALRALRIRQANLVGPAGYISMEDTKATELVQRGTIEAHDRSSTIEMALEAPEERNTLISEELIRRFWRGYARLMGMDLTDRTAA